MANVLMKGSVLTDNLFMQRVWAWTQCIAFDASVAGTIIRTFRCHAEGERVKTWLCGLLSALLLFTAAIVSNIESVQQTLNIALNHTIKLYKEGYIDEEEFQGEMAAAELALKQLDAPEVDGVTYDEVIEAGEHLRDLAALWDVATVEERYEMVHPGARWLVL